MKETLNDFINVKGTNVSAMEIAALEQQTNGQNNDFEGFVDSASQNQVIEINFEDKFRRADDKAVLTVENCMDDAILTVMDKVVNSTVEMAMKSITGSSGHGQNSEVKTLIEQISEGMQVTLRSCRPLVD